MHLTRNQAYLHGYRGSKILLSPAGLDQLNSVFEIAIPIRTLPSAAIDEQFDTVTGL